MMLFFRRYTGPLITLAMITQSLHAIPPRHITTAQEFDTILTYTQTPLLAIFSAPWCCVCTDIKEQLTTITQDNIFNELVTFVTVDFDTAKEICTRYAVDRVPTFCFFNNGKKIKQTIGVKNKELFSDQLKGTLVKTFHLPIKSNLTTANNHRWFNRLAAKPLRYLKNGIEWCLEKLEV
jgi:thioredoxin-like negative regulator of GroEL